MKLALFIPSLEIGGAERQMIVLAKALQDRGHEVSLWCLRATGGFEEEVSRLGLRVENANKGGRFDFLGCARRLRRIARLDAPDVIVSCLPSANLFALFARWVSPKIAKRRPGLIWGLASAKLPVGDYGWWAKVSYWVQAMSAKWVDKVVVNSVAGCDSAKQEGYPLAKLLVIHNGVDMGRFQFDAELGLAWRTQMNIPKDAKLVGMVGRLDPAKNYEVFLAACEQLSDQDERYWFVIVGGGDNDYAYALENRIKQHPLFGKRLLHKPNETEMAAMYSALDVMTLTSKSEGLPNTVVEAMACERRCVVTDVGDCRLAVDRFGQVCAVGDHQGIAKAWAQAIAQPMEESDRKSLLQYMHNHFSLEKMTASFEAVCAEVALARGQSVDKRNGRSG